MFFILFIVFETCRKISAASLCGAGGLEVVVYDTACDDLEVAKDGVGVARAKVPKQAAIVSAELQIGFLDEVVV
jgi:hypothetical protein